MSTRQSVRVFLLTTSMLVAAPSATAQTYLTNSNMTGTPEYGSFISSSIDQVNLVNGGVSINIPLVSRKARGVDFTYSYAFESKLWITQSYLAPGIPPDPDYTRYNWRPWSGGWSARSSGGGTLQYDEQQYTCSPWPNFEDIPLSIPAVVGLRTNWVYTSTDGTKYQFPLRQKFGIFDPERCQDEMNFTGQQLTGFSETGQAFLDITTFGQTGGAALIRFKNGSTWKQLWGQAYPRITDTNGNWCCEIDSQGWSLDTLGRRVRRNRTITAPTLEAVDYFDSNSGGSSYQSILIERYGNTEYQLNPSFPTTWSGPCGFDQTQISYPGAPVKKITLANGLSYTFGYHTWWDAGNPTALNPYGEVTKITLPTGGYIKYKWGTIAQRDKGPQERVVPVAPDRYDKPTQTTGTACSVMLDARVLLERRVSEDGTVGNETLWTYSYTATTTTVTDPDLNTEVHTFGYEFNGTNLETMVEYKNSSGVTLRRVQTDWAADNGPLFANMPYSFWDTGLQWVELGQRDSRVARTTTTLLDVSPNLVTKTETDFADSHTYTNFFTQYTNNRVNPTQTREYAYGNGSPGALVRYSTIGYWHGAGSPSCIFCDRVTEKKTFDAGSNLKAWSQFSYDTTTIAATSGVPYHDYTTHPSTMTSRGNQTLAKQWRNTDGAWFTTTNYFNDVGNLIQTTDPGGHSVQYSYADNFSDGVNRTSQGYVTQVTYPSTGGVSHIERKQYFWWTGLAAAQCGQNFSGGTACANTHTTQPDYAKFTYDLLGRPLTVVNGEGGQTTFAYTEPANPSYSNPVTVNSTTKLNASQNLVSTALIDGLGRVRQTQLTSDPCGVVYSDTTYDSLGRKSTASNPYRLTDPCNAGAATGSTAFEYDSLSRVKKVIPPSGGDVVTTYAGNTVTVTDQAGKQRKSYTDALGRLIQVDEPNPTLATPAVTTYTYDVLDNLTGVTQSGSRQRTFTYNSLSQLLTATNPESGAITYTYDADGNLSTKTDARGVTTTFNYDALHRMTSKWHSDGTPGAIFTFDVNNPFGITVANPVGRLVATWTGIVDQWAAWSAISYDSMGRITSQWNCLPLAPGCQVFQINASYDLAGNLTWLKYPSTREVKFSYDTASRLTQVNFDKWNASTVNYNYLSAATYAAHGAPTSMTLGNGLVESTTYNNRLQPDVMEIPNPYVSGGYFLKKQYNFVDGAGKNNGNVQAITDLINSGRTQTFTYDALNRLTSAQSAATSGADCWGQSYAYDIWANMTGQSVTKCSAPQLSLSINASNRITNTGFTYDAAGNLTADGSFTYQWDGESRMKSFNTTGATYTYDANGMRVRKVSGSDTTEYIYFGGQPIAERDATNGDWSDYIYAGGRRLARADSYEDRIWVRATHTGAGQISSYGFQGAQALVGYIIQPGDRLYWRQWQSSTARGGLVIQFTQAPHASWGTYDQDGQQINSDNLTNQWHYRRVDLTPFAGKTINWMWITADSQTLPGYYDMTFQDIALVSADGAVRRVFSRDKTIALTPFASNGVTGQAYSISHAAGVGWYPPVTTTYYHGDHLGSSRQMTNADGYPVWEATYLPYGQERAVAGSSASVNHYKFTGKERDGESGLDYFGARYYASAQGRFLSADWSATPTPVPYADFSSPQSLNLYAYVNNNPMNSTDPDGHCCEEVKAFAAGFVKGGVKGTLAMGAAAALGAIPGVRELVLSKMAQEQAKELTNAASKLDTLPDAVQELGSVQTAEILGDATGQVVVPAAIGGVIAERASGTATITRYMGEAEGTTAMRTGNIPNTSAAGNLRPTHVTTDPPVNSAGVAQARYELPARPTHRATVPAERTTLQRTPDGRSTTSGGGSQAATNKPIPVRADEIHKLKD